MIPLLIDLTIAFVFSVIVIWFCFRLHHAFSMWSIEREAAKLQRMAQRAAIRIELDKADLANSVIKLDANGLPPMSRKMLESGMTTEATFRLALAYIQANQTHAPTAHTLHYAPHIIPDKSAPVVVEAERLVDDNWHVPTFHELIGTDIFQPGRFLLGYSLENHDPVFGTSQDIYSCAIGGQPGTGKSTATRSLLAQSAMGGYKFAIVDYHYGAGEDSLGESLQSLRQAMLCDVASDDKTTVETVRYIDSIGRARRKGDKDRSPIMLVIDEATALFSRSSIGGEITTLLEAIAQEYRKVGVFALCLGQIWTASRTGGDSGLRDSFASALVCKMKRTQARMLVSTEVAKEVELLGIGQAILWKTNGEYVRLAIPNCTQADIEVIAKRLFPGTNKAPASITPVEPCHSLVKTVSVDVSDPSSGDTVVVDFSALMTPKAKRAISMFLDGAYTTDILREVWGVTGGGPKQMKASRELMDIIRLNMLQTGGN